MSDEAVLGMPAIRTIAMPADANANGDIFGGWLMGQMDLAAGLVAGRRAAGRVVTAAVDSMSFLHPVSIGDEVSIYANVISVGHTSMRIEVAAFRRERSEEAQTKVTSARFVFVAVDPHGKPRAVPPET